MDTPLRYAFQLTVFALAVGASGATLAQSPPSFDDSVGRVTRAASGTALTRASTAAPPEVVTGYLRANGRSNAVISSLRAARTVPGANGVRHVRMEQVVDGLSVHGAYLKAAVNARGELVHVIDKLADVSPMRAPKVDPLQALQVTMAQLHPGQTARFWAKALEGNSVRYDGGTFFHADPEVTAVAIPMNNGRLERGWLVETWTQKDNRLHHTLVGGDGRVLDVELRTANESYNIFPIDPGKGGQQVVAGPLAGNGSSPAGWLNGVQTSLEISGNNVFAYLDRNDDNLSDGGGSLVSSNDFLSIANLGTDPTGTTNQEVAIQNLFYLNNRIHDILYGHGFNEAAGNFQTNNFGLGGRGNDPVQAEAQDGGGTDNANFATPRDGRAPRMQMYLWNGRPSHLVNVGGTRYEAAGSAFGPAITTTGFTGALQVASPADGCTAITALPSGSIAIVDRGTCEFSTKVLNAQNAGAAGVVIANNNTANPTEVFGPAAGADAPSVTIPSVMVGYSSGAALKLQVGASATVVNANALMIDASLDSDIVYHEYCHGLTWRMIGRMSGPLAGAIGEGMSDVCALMINSDPTAAVVDDVVAEYSASDPRGIRSAPYTNHLRTYGSIGVAAGSPQVHFDGEIYAAIIWDLMGRFAQTYPADWRARLFTYLVDGMNYTPAKPAYEDMRDGILAAVAAGSNPQDCVKVWDAFALRGVGLGATGTVRGSRVIVTESVDKPVTCN
jgi:extracellular elastinolytic metalloproteinase